MDKEKRVNTSVRVSRFIFTGLAWGLVACIVIRTFLAGMAIFSNPMYWTKHIVFVHLFEILPILMLIFAFAGRLPKTLRWQSAGLLGLIFAQYFTANMKSAAALHPVIALIIFSVSWIVAKQAGQWRFRSDEGGVAE